MAATVTISSSAIPWFDRPPGHQRDELALARRELVQRAVLTLTPDHALHHLRVERRAARGDAAHRVEEDRQVADAVLEQLAKSIYSVPTWTKTVALIREHHALAAAIAPDGDVPSVSACCRFTAKLRTYGDSSTVAAPPSSASSTASRTNGRSPRYAFAAWIAFGLHADLTILAKLACALSRARTVQIAA